MLMIFFQVAQQKHQHLNYKMNCKQWLTEVFFFKKGFTFSGYLLCASLSSDGECVGVAGLRMCPEDDKIALDISELNFSRKYRRKKSSTKINAIPSKLTRRHCVSKVSEIDDLTGLVTPITAGMKTDLHTLV